MRNEFAAFLDYIELAKKRSSRTAQIYRQILFEFEAYLSGTSPDEENARAFLRQKAASVSSTTQALHVSVLRSLSRWMRTEGLSKDSWMLKSPKVDRKKIRVFAEEDLSLLMQVIEQRPIEEKILFYLLYGSALRISEALSLELKNIDFKKQKARVLGKGSRWREVPVLNEAIELLSAQKHDLNNFWHGGALNYSIAHKWVVSWGQESGLNQKYDALHPHLLRHALASHLLRRGGKLPHIQKLLGHSRLSTTEKYTHLDIDDLVRAYDKALGVKRS